MTVLGENSLTPLLYEMSENRTKVRGTKNRQRSDQVFVSYRWCHHCRCHNSHFSLFFQLPSSSTLDSMRISASLQFILRRARSVFSYTSTSSYYFALYSITLLSTNMSITVYISSTFMQFLFPL